MATATIHGYFIDKARAAFVRAGGDPDRSGPLAEWAQAAREANDSRRGVIVAEDGEIMAETRYHPGGASATYVTEADSSRWQLFGNEVGLALGQISRQSGKRVIHIKFSEVCQGAGTGR